VAENVFPRLRTPACRRNPVLGEASEGALEAPSDYMTSPIITLDRVSKRYDVEPRGGTAVADRALEAVTDFSVEVAAGEFVSIIGPSGCGKTTILFLLAGLRSPSSGRIEVCGRAPLDAVRAGLASVIFQQPVLFEWLTVQENVLLPLRMRDRRWWVWPLRRHRYHDRAQEVLATVELESFAHFYPDALSGGMQQRVAIARALTLAPRVLLLDEPFGALDELARDRMNRELLRLWEMRALTIVFVTHSIEEAVFLSDRVVVMSRGRSAHTSSSIVRVLKVDLPRPRHLALKEEVAFFEKVREGREALRDAQPAA
jgi:NitT/TauT family transport system ATP-binding protein